ncbi:MAG TPA: Smr/MutS family protein [Vicinamibacterales bacterium]|nr:Smr/MutS family protein [Vicinamibacterales bacterium]
MKRPLAVGDPVQTALGKGVVREVRNNGRLLVEIEGRGIVVDGTDATLIDVTGRVRNRARGGTPGPAPPPRDSSPRLVREIDLHGLTVDEALARAEGAINDALLADVSELRVIHGRSGGRIRAALHRLLRQTPSVRLFRIDARNPGVTVVTL